MGGNRESWELEREKDGVSLGAYEERTGEEAYVRRSIAGMG